MIAHNFSIIPLPLYCPIYQYNPRGSNTVLLQKKKEKCFITDNNILRLNVSFEF